MDLCGFPHWRWAQESLVGLFLPSRRCLGMLPWRLWLAGRAWAACCLLFSQPCLAVEHLVAAQSAACSAAPSACSAAAAASEASESTAVQGALVAIQEMHGERVCGMRVRCELAQQAVAGLEAATNGGSGGGGSGGGAMQQQGQQRGQQLDHGASGSPAAAAEFNVFVGGLPKGMSEEVRACSAALFHHCPFPRAEAGAACQGKAATSARTC